MIGVVLKLLSKNVLQDMVETVVLVKNSGPRSGPSVRVPMLTDDPPRETRGGAVARTLGYASDGLI